MPPIDATTRLCALIGNPVEHSLSPAIHNAAFQHLGLNFVYVAFNVEDVEGAMHAIRALTGIRGVSVTIPHKVAVLRHLDEVEPTARSIGAVNTNVADRGKLTGYNTDASGALAALPNGDRKSTRLNSSHLGISYAVFCLKKKNIITMLTVRIS